MSNAEEIKSDDQPAEQAQQVKEARDDEQAPALPGGVDLVRWFIHVSGWPASAAAAGGGAHSGDKKEQKAPARVAGEPGPLNASGMDIAPVVEQLSRFIGIVTESPDLPYCEFTLEFTQLGNIEGHVLVEGGVAQVVLHTRRSDTAAFLRGQKSEIERMASRHAGIGIRLSVRDR